MKLMPWQKGSDGSANGEAPAEPAPVVSESVPVVAPAIDPTWVASMEDRSKQLSDAVEKLSQDNAALAQENKRLQKEVSAVTKADADENTTEIDEASIRQQVIDELNAKHEVELENQKTMYEEQLRVVNSVKKHEEHPKDHKEDHS